MVAQQHRRGQDEDEHRVEWHAGCQGEQQETFVRHHLPVAARECQRREGLAPLGRQGFRQHSGGEHQHADRHEREEPEDRTPAEPGEQPAANDRRDRRCCAEEQGDLAHQLLRMHGGEQVPHDGAPDHDAGAAAHALQHAPPDQHAHMRRGGAHDTGEREYCEPDEDDGAAAEAVGQRTVEQHHHREAGEVARQRLLQMNGCRRKAVGDALEGRQVGVDREGAERGQGGQQSGEHPHRPAPGNGGAELSVGRRRHRADPAEQGPRRGMRGGRARRALRGAAPG